MIRSLINTIRFIIEHPLNKENKMAAILRFLKWQVNIRLNPSPVVYPFACKSKMWVWKGLRGATGNLYCGLHEFEEMIFVLHFLRAEDLFTDVGANIGSYTLLAANEVGAKTIAIEPGPEAYRALKNNLTLNELTIEKVKPLNIALGAKKGLVNLTRSLDTENYITEQVEPNTISVELECLDDVLGTSYKPTLIKIDVEGYEMEVLKGMTKALESEQLTALIIELNGLTNQFGYSPEQIHQLLLTHHFRPFAYLPFERRLVAKDSFGKHNTIYLRNIDLASKRVATAAKIKIHGQEI